MTKRIVELLTRPMTAGFIAAITTALILPPTVIHNETLIERVVVRDPTAPQVIHEVVYRTQRVCDGESVIRALNEALGSLAKTGKAGVDNDADASARARAKGDAAASVAQSGVATSGLANAGQIINAINLGCGTITIDAHNTVIDTEVRSGDAEVTNEADVTAQVGGPPTSTADSAPPLVQDEEPDSTDEKDDPDEDGDFGGAQATPSGDKSTD